VHVTGIVEYWNLTIRHRDQTVTEEHFHSWESVTEAFHETKATDPLLFMPFNIADKDALRHGNMKARFLNPLNIRR
jgi:hypothetical protein